MSQLLLISAGGISIKFLVCLEMLTQTRSRRHIGIWQGSYILTRTRTTLTLRTGSEISARHTRWVLHC